MVKKPERYNSEERFENPNKIFTGFFQGQAYLNTGRVAGYYYNACTKVAFENSPENQSLESKNNFLNHRNQDYIQVPLPFPQYPTY